VLRERLTSTVKRRPRLWAALICTLLTLSLLFTRAEAYQVYKTVDADGRVAYSTHPPADSVSMEIVKIHPGPSVEEQAEAAEHESAIKQATGDVQRQREALKAERAQSVGTARDELSAAKADLEAARQIRDDDWQGLVSGKRRLKPSYHDRVQSSKQRHETARVNLQSAKQRQN
jgi:hypothetical protein